MPTITFNNIQDLIIYINQYIRVNHNNEITGEEHNNVEIGLTGFIISSPRNYNRAQVENTASAFVAVSSQCILIFKKNAIGSIQLIDNKWNEWVIYNNSGANKQLIGAINGFITPAGVFKNYIPSATVVHLAKGNNNIWYQMDNGAATNTTPKPLIGVVGGGGANDPTAGLVAFQSNSLIGLGSSNSDRIQIVIDDITYSNFGTNSNFTFVSATGTLSGIFWVAGAGLFVDLNQ